MSRFWLLKLNKRSTITRIYLALASAGLFLVGSVSLVVPNAQAGSAGINSTINYQGRLLTATGAVVPDGTYNMEFQIWQDGNGCITGCTSANASTNNGGTLKWTEDWVYGSGTPDNRVTIKNGYFSVSLGSITSLASVNFNWDTNYLTSNIGNTSAAATFSVASGDGIMIPFKRMAANPYSFNSGQLGGLTSSQYVQLGQSVQAVSSTNAAIGLNQTSTGNILDLQKGGADVQLINNAGQTLFRPTTDSQTALQVQKAGTSTTVFTVDSTNARIGIGTGAPAYAVDAVGSVNASVSLKVAGTDVCTVTGCTAATGSTAYIQNQNSGAQASSNFNISGSGTAASFLTGVIDNPSGIISIGTGTGSTAVNIGKAPQAVTIAGNLSLSGVSTGANNKVSLSGSVNSTGTGSQYGIQVALDFNPQGASLGAIYGEQVSANIASSSLAINTLNGGTFGVSTGAGYTGTVAGAAGIQISGPTIGGSNPFGTYRGLDVGTNSTNGGNTTGTLVNQQLNIRGITAGAGTGGTVNNYGINLLQPSGTGGTTNNYGLYISGAGAGTSNYSIYNSSTALSLFNGNIGINNTSNAANLAVNASTGGTYTDTALFVNTGNNANRGVVIQVGAVPTGNAFQVVNSAGVVNSGISAGGRAFFASVAPINPSTVLSVNTGSATGVALALQAAPSQSADIVQLRDTNGSTISTFSSVGQLTLGTATQLGTSGTAIPGVLSLADSSATNSAAGKYGSISLVGNLASNQTYLLPTTGGTICLTTGNCNAAGGYIVNGTSVQPSSNFNISGTGQAATLLTANLGVNNATPTNPFAINAYGTGTYTNSQLYVNTAANANVGITIQVGGTVPTANPFQIVNSTGTILGGFTGGGRAFYGSAAPISAIGVLSASTGSTANVGLQVQGVASQTANLFETKSNVGDTLSSFGPTGQLTVGTVNVLASGGTAVAGSITLGDGSDTTSVAAKTGTINIAGALVSNQTYSLPTTGGTICLTSGNCSAAGGYIVNGTGLQASSNFNISGTGTAATSILTPLLDTASSVPLNIGNSSSAINLNQNTTIAAGKTLSLSNGTAGNTVISTQVTGDTNSRFTIGSDGTINFGSGSAATDTSIYRSGVGNLQTNNNLTASSNLQIGAAGYIGKLTVQASNTGTQGLVIKQFAGQSVAQLNLYDSNGISQANFSNTGVLRLGNVASSGTVYQGTLQFGDGTTDNLVTTLTSNTITGTRNISLPDASGTICLTSGNCSAAGGYIVNNTTLQASSNFNISGTGTANIFRAGTIDAASAGTLYIAPSTATGISLGGSAITTTVAGALTVNSGATFTNASSTLNSAITIGNFTANGNIGASAAVTVDIATTINIAQTTTGPFTLSLFNPTVTTAGRVVYVSDTGTAAFKIGSVVLTPNTTGIFVWNGTVWTSGGIDGSGANYVQNTTTTQNANFNIQAATTGSVAAVITANAAGAGDILDLVNGAGTPVVTVGSTGNVLFKASAASSTAFQLQSSTGGSIITYDSNGLTLTIGNGGNNMTFASTYEPTLNGTARHTKQITLTAEYAGAVFDTAKDGACVTANNGTLTSGYASGIGIGSGTQNYYLWTSAVGSAQCADIVVQVPIPSDFAAWASTTPLTLTTNYTNSTNSSIKMLVQDTTGTTESAYTGYGSSLNPPSPNIWATVTGGALTGTYTAGGTMNIRIRMTAQNASSLNVGNLTLSYLSKY